MVDGGGLENRWVNSPRGSNPLLSDFFLQTLLAGEVPERPKGVAC